MSSRKTRYLIFVVCLSVLLGFSWSAQGADRVKKGDVPVKTPTSPLPLPPGYKQPAAAPLPPAGAAPASVKVTATQPHQVVVTWAATAGASGYGIAVGASPTTVNQHLGSVAAAGPLKWFAPQLPNSTMYYKVYATYPNLGVGGSAVVAGTTPPEGTNPSGFTATAAPGIEGKVILKWNPVPGGIHYLVKGDGVPAGSDTMPAPIMGTTYTTQGFGGVNPSWTLYTVYKAPSGDTYWGNESNPARASIKMGWYKYSLIKFQVQSATYDDMLNRDGWADEVYISLDVNETTPGGQVPGFSGRVPQLGNFGDVSNRNNTINAGIGRPGTITGGLVSGSEHYGPWEINGKKIPFRVWCGPLFEGQTAITISESIWEWDDAPGATAEEWMAVIKKMNMDLQNDRVRKAATTFNPVFGAFMDAGAVMTEMGAQAVLDVLSVLGTPGTRPIGMTSDGKYSPRVAVLTYENAEGLINRGPMFGDDAGTISIHYQEPVGKLNGDYTIKGKVERISGPQVCQQWP